MSITSELLSLVSRQLTGALFSNPQIDLITQHSVGKHFTDLFPENEEKKSRADKLQSAKIHIEQASNIIAEMKLELENQSVSLDQLILEIEEKRGLAKRYADLAETNKEAADSIKTEISESLRAELIAQSETGKTSRRIASFIVWASTLLIGAFLGLYLKDIIDALQGK